jgi:nitrite reductase (cytochrome c-552)
VAAKWQEAIKRIPKEMQDYGMSCVHCHNPHSAQLQIINKGLINAIARDGVNPYWKERNVKSFAKADKQQKEILLVRAVPCGICLRSRRGQEDTLRFQLA